MKNAFIQKLPLESILLNKCTIKNIYRISISLFVLINQEKLLRNNRK